MDQTPRREIRGVNEGGIGERGSQADTPADNGLMEALEKEGGIREGGRHWRRREALEKEGGIEEGGRH